MGFLDLFRSQRVSQTPPPHSQAPSKNIASGSDGNFFMTVEDVFEIKGRGGVVVGKIERGTIKAQTPVLAKGTHGEMQLMVMGIEMFKKKQDSAAAGESVGLLIKGYNGSLKDFGIQSLESIGGKPDEIF